MSVDSTDLERSALEKKDREELTTIATALGGKPGSRARKADIIGLILELTGVGSEAAAPSEGSAKEPQGGDRAEAKRERGRPANGRRSSKKEAEAPRSGPGQEPRDTAEATTSEGPSQEPVGRDPAPEPPAEWEIEAGDAQPGGGSRDRGRPSSTRDDARGAGRREQDGRNDRSRDDRAKGDQAPDDQAPDDQAPDDQAKSGQSQREPARSDQGQANQGTEEGDTGNRRRRRRGRNRDRGNEQQPEEFSGEPVEVSGLLDLRDEGYGFIRLRGYLPSKDDVYVSVKQIRQFGLRRGDHIAGASRPALRNEKNPALLRIDRINGEGPDGARDRRRFEDLTPLFPDERLKLEMANDASNMTARIVDLISPIGKGQRGLIVSPPKAGKTTVMKQVARAVEVNNPEVHLFVLLVDERPEEVTDMRRWLRNERSEVVASTFDRPSEEHTQVSELTIERAKRLVEAGHDVMIILDGITRLARAYNLAAPPTGRIMSGGIDTGALYPPKKFFGAARNVEEGGSLTILATALVETGSRMDEVIFEEFKGTGNMELRLDRRMAERRIYPAIDVDASSTRHEELLFPRVQLQLVWKLRRVLSGLASGEGERGQGAGLELLLDRMKSFKSNDEFLSEIAKAPTGS